MLERFSSGAETRLIRSVQNSKAARPAAPLLDA